MITTLFTQNCVKILSLFSLSPGYRATRRSLQINTRLNNVPLDKALSRLVNARILNHEKNYYYINFENDFSQKFLEITTIQFKRLKELPFSVYCLLIDLTHIFSREKKVELILFGSYAKRFYNKHSDINIALIFNSSIDKKKITKKIQKLEQTYEKTIEIHFFEKTNFYNEKNDPLVKAILTEGVRLSPGQTFVNFDDEHWKTEQSIK